ncbi:uncharacterized protein BDZ99DRAFT_527021 [Mytilinidion resinicola]|uniref:Yeast cell wall synthesis Kre9/Knh1-like N-terminal domain-containing protein n=1 Tax=Mytilinidion resinicola TaxID=574789 RepID=A0A6A6Y2B2_9PEZI|nr:uncharacterized protein BDZ99DRAFT_527021 [Mytilinidion resinicola]KAF2802922.1 hypothetical protein BDZ99DRAFT_527021 [Mytilinidion resinicola]
MELILCFLVLALTSCVSAVVTFLQPTAGAEIQGGESFTVQWILEDGTIPAANLTTYKLALCAGGNNASSQAVLSTLVQSAAFSNNTELSENIETSIGGSDINAYFFMLVTNYTGGGTITSFSSRFTLSYMHGTFDSTVLAGIQFMSASTTGPTEILDIPDSTGTPTATSSLSSSGSPTASSSSTATTSPTTSAGLSKSGVVGLALGVPLCMMGLALAGYLLYQHRKKRSERPWKLMGSELDLTSARAELDARPSEAEMHTPANVHEIGDSKELAVELPG